MPYNSKKYSKKQDRDITKKRKKNTKVAIVPKPQICPYCGASVNRVHSSQIFHNNTDGFYYVCSNWPRCTAYTKENPIFKKPTSTIADRATRLKRQEAHYWFDQMHIGFGMTKSAAYEWLAKELQIRRANCHIGLFDIEMCNRVISIVSSKLGSSIRTKSLDQHIKEYQNLKAQERSIPVRKKYHGIGTAYRNNSKKV